MGIFISGSKTAECVAVALIFSAALCAVAYKPLGVLQASGYANRKFFKWIRKKGNLLFGRLVLLAMLCALSSAVVALCFSFTGEWAAALSLVPYVLLFAVYIAADRKISLRSSVTATPRFLRLLCVLFLVCAIVCYLLTAAVNFADYAWGNALFSRLRYCALALLPLLLLPLIMAGNALAKIYETPHNKKFIKKAKEKLARADVTVVAVTGSYGKTSTKFILKSLLGEKFRVLATPRSHNTPVGIALAVNGCDFKDIDVFIAEMGARHKGDIAELCEICPPDLSLLTGICAQHLETFKTVEEIVRAKGEILSATRKRAFIADDCYDLFASAPCEKERCCCVSDVECSPDGTAFTLTLDGEARRVKTKLLGKHAAYNIGLAAQAAHCLGMTADEIASAIGRIDFIEHRLQLIRSGGVNILDDGYNGNVKGARAALKVLKSFGGKKIVVTPGLVELGVLEEEENAALGAELVFADAVILVGETQVCAVKRGYLSGGGSESRLQIVPTLAAAQEELKKELRPGDTVLFLNDLPDVY